MIPVSFPLLRNWPNVAHRGFVRSRFPAGGGGLSGCRHQYSDRVCPSSSSSSLSLDERRKRRREYQSAGRENRIAVLEELLTETGSLSHAQTLELAGLRATAQRFEEQYDPTRFSDHHHAFKESHNRAFVSLIRYCSSAGQRGNHNNGQEHRQHPTNVFFLDGPDGRTAKTLHSAGMLVDNSGGGVARLLCSCHVPNRHQSTCDALRAMGLPNVHVSCSSATTALEPEGDFASIRFHAYYLDGCGGHPPQIIDMLEAALTKERYYPNSRNNGNNDTTTIPVPPNPIAVGFSVVGGNRDVVDKEVQIVQSLVKRAKQLRMRVNHVFDDPARFGVDPTLKKVQGGTMTSWFFLEPTER